MSFIFGSDDDRTDEVGDIRDGADVREITTEHVETIASEPGAPGRDEQVITICSTADDFDRKWITAETEDSWTYLEDMA